MSENITIAKILVDDIRTKLIGETGNLSFEGKLKNYKEVLDVASRLLGGNATKADIDSARAAVHPSNAGKF